MDEPYDQALGRAVEMMLDRSQVQAAAVLLDCRVLKFEYVDSAFILPLDDSDPITLMNAWLMAPTHIWDRIDGELASTIKDTLNEALEPDGIYLGEVKYTAPPPAADWRERASSRLREGPVNQGSVGRSAAEFNFDGMRFRSAAEVAVYKALKAEQGKRPQTDNLVILPLPAARVVGNRFEPDFVVIFRGATGIIEVDGPHHRSTAAEDRSRDRIFRHGGVAEVDRKSVADTDNSDQLARFVAAFLYRLGKPRH